VAVAEVLVVEDEEFTRTLINATVQALGFQVVGSCSTAAEALAVVKTSSVSVALLDLDLGPGPSGVDIAHALRAVNPLIGIVMLTTFVDPRLHDAHERNLPKGTRYLVKTQLDDLRVLRATLTDAQRNPLRRIGRTWGELSLTSLQLEVLRMVSLGKSNSEIASAQGVTDKAVEGTVKRITEALGLGDHDGNRRVLLARAYAELTGKPLPS
jgi:two-component system invasion response regulator UvrY